MHERSLLLALLHQVSRIQAEHGDAAVEEIAVEAGWLSGVEPALLRSAFLEFAPQYPQASLTVQTVPVTAQCQACRHAWDMDRFTGACPACRSPLVQITGGDALRLLYVTLKENSDGRCL